MFFTVVAHSDDIDTEGALAEMNGALREVLGPDLPNVTYVVLHEVPKDTWGYGGLTQEARAAD